MTNRELAGLKPSTSTERRETALPSGEKNSASGNGLVRFARHDLLIPDKNWAEHLLEENLPDHKEGLTKNSGQWELEVA